MSAGFQDLPPNLPVPEDDGAADHLEGMALPNLRLASSFGGTENLAELASECLVARQGLLSRFPTRPRCQPGLTWLAKR